MEPDVLNASRRQNLLMGVPEGIRVVHRPRLGRREHIRAVRVLLMLRDEQIHRLFRDWDGADGVACLGLAHFQLAIDPVHLFGHRDGHVLHIQVSPEKRQQLTPPQAAGELQVVRREQAAPVGLLEVGSDLLGEKHFHLLALDFRQTAAAGGVGDDQPLAHRLIQRLIEHLMDAPDEPVAQAFVLQLDVRVPLDPPGGFQLIVEPLDIERGQLVQLDVAQAWDDMLLDVVVVVV